jgi:hypothetical protein
MNRKAEITDLQLMSSTWIVQAEQTTNDTPISSKGRKDRSLMSADSLNTSWCHEFAE